MLGRRRVDELKVADIAGFTSRAHAKTALTGSGTAIPATPADQDVCPFRARESESFEGVRLTIDRMNRFIR